MTATVPHKVLVVDDDDHFLKVCLAVLRRAGFEVDGVGDPLEALTRLGSGRYDAVVYDLCMPALSGKVLLVLPSPSESGAVEKSFRNIRGVRVAYARSLGVWEVVGADRVLLTGPALDVLEGASAEGEAEATPRGGDAE